MLPKSLSASDVGQTFLSAGSGDFPVPGFRVKLSALVREVGKLRNRQARKPALPFGQHAHWRRRKSPCRRWMIGKRNGSVRKMWKAESGKLKCATKVAAGGFPVAAGCHRAIELARGSGSGLGKYYKTRNRPVHDPFTHATSGPMWINFNGQVW